MSGGWVASGWRVGGERAAPDHQQQTAKVSLASQGAAPVSFRRCFRQPRNASEHRKVVEGPETTASESA
eukprot:13514753-Alexandrium_andersonii.AAC.1